MPVSRSIDRAIAEDIFLTSVKSVLAGNIIGKSIYLKGEVLYAGSRRYEISAFDNIYVIGFGKASGHMAIEIEDILGEYIKEGLVITKYGHGEITRFIKIIEAGHPLPDINGLEGTKQLMNLIRKVKKNDLVIILISGGGSSLLIDCPTGSSLNELQKLNELLLNCGAAIFEMNTVRKHLSGIKGGQLAAKIFPGTTLSLILSDVINNQLDVIASGPTVPDPTTFKDAIDVLNKFNLRPRIASSLLRHLMNGTSGIISETPKPNSRIFQNVYNLIIGSNEIALSAARDKAFSLGFNTFIMDSKIEGNLEEVGVRIINDAIKYQEDSDIQKPVCLLYGGEPTLKVFKSGLGGRNQHLVLKVLQKLNGRKGITFLSAGTDGTDGSTSVAGAVIDYDTIKVVRNRRLNIDYFLKNFDSFGFFKIAGGHIITGPTGTNVMDIIIVLIQ